MSGSNADGPGGGGGGGSFVVLAGTNEPLVIAGGGGGAGGSLACCGGGGAVPGQIGLIETIGGAFGGGTNGAGGAGSGSAGSDQGGGGGGFSGDGLAGQAGGRSFLNGGAGGIPNGLAGTGGFGGGGAGAFQPVNLPAVSGGGAGGGGGGYSGGGTYSPNGGGGGGGSFLSALVTQTLALAGANPGNGRIIINFVSGSAVPEPNSWALILIGFALLSLAVRHRIRQRADVNSTKASPLETTATRSISALKTRYRSTTEVSSP